MVSVVARRQIAGTEKFSSIMGKKLSAGGWLALQVLLVVTTTLWNVVNVSDWQMFL